MNEKGHHRWAAVAQVRNASENFSWENVFRNLNTNEMVVVFNILIKVFYLTTFHITLS